MPDRPQLTATNIMDGLVGVLVQRWQHGRSVRGEGQAQVRRKPSSPPLLPAGKQGCQVGLFKARYDKFGLFLTVGLEIVKNLLSSWPFFQVVAYLVFDLFLPKFI